jgi:hypothetical protein
VTYPPDVEWATFGTYDTEEEAKGIAKEYHDKGYYTRVVKRKGKYIVRISRNPRWFYLIPWWRDKE